MITHVISIRESIYIPSFQQEIYRFSPSPHMHHSTPDFSFSFTIFRISFFYYSPTFCCFFESLVFGRLKRTYVPGARCGESCCPRMIRGGNKLKNPKKQPPNTNSTTRSLADRATADQGSRHHPSRSSRLRPPQRAQQCTSTAGRKRYLILYSCCIWDPYVESGSSSALVYAFICGSADICLPGA